MSYTEGGHNAHNIELWQASQTLQGAHTFTEIARFRFQIKLLLASLIMRSGPGRATAMSAKGLNSPDTSSEAMPDDSSPWTIQTKTKRKFKRSWPNCLRLAQGQGQGAEGQTQGQTRIKLGQTCLHSAADLCTAADVIIDSKRRPPRCPRH
ncbi:hypothetical protein PHLGIDRAFT_219191 [Phlebiopsis gigantea 11061_1 CR5-6]|uniref:Uncharacterized protein n=1 Tax=Phlebiopsis gigantea (strain 11061_1 CR5-6) TaxID=745531 RepID=A0A0C3PSX9_PHLG1|nr:hypothetical protein PHLGIDRAFT_219191 [Phlebiopsis gigantea 11061_1 CR5-6]